MQASRLRLPGIRAQLHFQLELFTNVPGGQQIMAQVLGILPLMWGTQKEFQSPGLSLTQASIVPDIWGGNQRTYYSTSNIFKIKRVDQNK